MSLDLPLSFFERPRCVEDMSVFVSFSVSRRFARIASRLGFFDGAEEARGVFEEERSFSPCGAGRFSGDRLRRMRCLIASSFAVLLSAMV